MRILAEAGVRQIYGVSGDSLNCVTDAMRAKKTIQWIHVGHEETAAFAAGAEAHLTGQLAVCAGGDLLSLRQLPAPVKVIVFKNDSLAFVELEMKAAGIVDYGTDLRNPDFAKMAEAAGLLGLKPETPRQVAPMIQQALKHDGPALVEVLVSRQELSMPPIISEQAKGFSFFMLKAVLSGRGEEVVDLAGVNLFP